MSEQAKEDLADYVRQDKLIVTAVACYDPVSEKAEVKQYGNRLGMEEFRKFFDANKEGAKVVELKDIFSELKEKYNDVASAASKTAMISALQEYESNHPENCVLIESEDQFYGVSRGTNILEKYIQWIFLPAVKDATEESEESNKSALGQLLARTVRSHVSFDEKIRDLRNSARVEYQKLLDAEQATLNEISESLQDKLSNWAHPNVKASIQWKQDPDKSVKIEEPLAGLKVKERGFEGELSRFGHGLQRSYMLALLQELKTFESENIPTLVMGIEEPELFQHPPQARYLAETLMELSQNNNQVILCTHSPLFIPGNNFDKIRLVCEKGDPSETKVKYLSYSELANTLAEVGEKHVSEKGMIAKLYPSLNPVVNEMFFCKKLILVEGYEDLAYITTYLLLTGKINEFRRNGCHIVPVGGKSQLIKPLAIAKLLEIQTMVIYDCDTNKDNEDEVNRHKKDNKVILGLKGHTNYSEWPNETIVLDDLIAWKTNLTCEVENDFDSQFKKYETEAALLYGNAGGLKKNPLGIAKALELAWNKDVKSSLLIDLIDRVINFCEG